MRRRLRIALLVVCIPALLWWPVLTGVAAFMDVGTAIDTADVILPLYDDPDAEAPAIVELYRDGTAPLVLLYQTEPGRLERLGLLLPAEQMWRRLLTSRGIPGSALHTLPGRVVDRSDLGRELASFAHGRPLRVIVVTPRPWSRVRRNALRRGIGSAPVDLRVSVVAPVSFDGHAWWRSRAGWLAYFDAYTLWLLAR